PTCAAMKRVCRKSAVFVDCNAHLADKEHWLYAISCGVVLRGRRWKAPNNDVARRAGDVGRLVMGWTSQPTRAARRKKICSIGLDGLRRVAMVLHLPLALATAGNQTTGH